MKKLLFLSLLLFLNCSKNSLENCNDKVRETESIAISQAILQFVSNDTLNLPFCNSLERLNVKTDLDTIYKKITYHKINSDFNRDLYVQKLLAVKIDGHFFFGKNDSLNFVHQNCATSFKLPETILRNRKAIATGTIRKNPNAEYIRISYPIFSADNQKVYVEIDIYSKETKFGNALYLQKVGSKWKIIDIQGLWDI